MQKNTVSLVNSMNSKKFKISFLFFIFLCVLIHLWFLRYFYDFVNDVNIIMSVARRKNMIEQYPKNSTFILVWNKYNNILRRFGINNGLLNCSVSDCVITDDKNQLYNYMRYDAIIFDEFALNSVDRPNERSKHQFYIFSSQKSSYDAPACEVYNEDFFNLTFTYKLDSDFLWSYIAVQNLSGEMVAPKVSVNWKKSSKPISREIKLLLIRKNKIAAWLVNQDKHDDSTVEYISRLQDHLFHYSLKIDVYGQPPLLRCRYNDCQKTIRDKYYFYMAFENSFSADHVTDIVLNGYNNYAVPVVYGGANYSRFLPPGSYIDARNFHPYNLAHVMYEAIKDRAVYEEYFRWTNLYTIHDNSKSLKTVCNLCETIHRYKANRVSKLAKKQFRHWWNGLNGMKRCLSDAYRNEQDNLNACHMFHLQ